MFMPRTRKKQKVQTTLRLPRRSYEQAQAVVRREPAAADSINELLIHALGAHLKALRRQEVDAGFAGMENDLADQQETEKIMKEFEYADAEAFRLMEKKRRSRHAARRRLSGGI